VEQLNADLFLGDQAWIALKMVVEQPQLTVVGVAFAIAIVAEGEQLRVFGH